MPKSITVRFYEIGKMAANGPSLRDALQRIHDTGEPGAREGQLAEGFRCRLERFTPEVGFVSGEMLRVRDSDFPCEVHPEGTRILGVDGPIGDGVAFRFRERDNRLAMQYDQRIVSPGRFIDYIGTMLGAPLFSFEPTVDDEAIRRFREQPLRKLKIKLASPQNLAEVEDPMQAAAQAFRGLGEDYGAPVITVEMSMGHTKGQLAEGAKQLAEGFLRMVGRGTDVRGVVATSDPGEGIENEDINLLDHLLSVKDDIIIEGNDPAVIYRECAAFVSRTLAAHG